MKFIKIKKVLSLLIIITGLTPGIFYAKISKISYDLKQLENKVNIVSVAVVGGGPGGLSAAFNAARERFHTVLFVETIGGQMRDTNHVENWPGIVRELGSDLINTIEKQAVDAGALLVPENIVAIDCSSWPFKLTTQSGTVVYALSVIIATGAQPRKLNVAGEKEYWGKGVASCTLCDAPFTRDADVVIVGGGDSSIEFATNVAPFAKSISLITKNEKLFASQRMKKRLAKYPAIQLFYDTKVQEILGDGEHVNAVKIKNLKTEKIETLPTQWVFLSIGQEPNTKMLNGQLPVNKEGCIIVPSKSQETNIKGIFVAGRVSDSPYKTGIIASGEGLKAALDAIAFLENLGFEEKMEEELKDKLFYYNTNVNVQPVKASVEEIETEQEINAIKSNKNTVLLEFYSPTCPHCRAMERVVSAVAQELKGSVQVMRADVNKFAKAIKSYKVTGLPTFIILKNGKELKRLVGEVSQKELLSIFMNKS